MVDKKIVHLKKRQFNTDRIKSSKQQGHRNNRFTYLNYDFVEHSKVIPTGSEPIGLNSEAVERIIYTLVGVQQYGRDFAVSTGPMK